MSATDSDGEAFGPVYYEIVEGDPSGNFSINNETGLIETGTVLDRELQQNFILIIKARDSKYPLKHKSV